MSAWPAAPLTRFAPAPTGYLHLGHVLNAVHVWGAARAHGGRVLLRIEDHDRSRSRAEYETAILDDLDWLGFQPDLYPTSAFRAGPCDSRQSDREEIYREAVATLRARGLLYGCDCTRAEVAAGTPPDRPELHYSGRCRSRGLSLSDAVGWRVRMEPGAERFVDAMLGPQEQEPAAQCGDLLIRDRHGFWTYQFAVTVDDVQQQIDLVVRGADLLASTGRQIRLARLLGRERPPVFQHHPLIMRTPDRKLSKSDGDTGVRDLRRSGLTAEQVIADAMRAAVPV